MADDSARLVIEIRDEGAEPDRARPDAPPQARPRPPADDREYEPVRPPAQPAGFRPQPLPPAGFQQRPTQAGSAPVAPVQPAGTPALTAEELADLDKRYGKGFSRQLAGLGVVGTATSPSQPPPPAQPPADPVQPTATQPAGRPTPVLVANRDPIVVKVFGQLAPTQPAGVAPPREPVGAPAEPAGVRAPAPEPVEPLTFEGPEKDTSPLTLAPEPVRPTEPAGLPRSPDTYGERGMVTRGIIGRKGGTAYPESYQLAGEPPPTEPAGQRYRYEGLDPKTGQSVGGTVEAGSEEEAKRKASAKGPFVTSVKPVPVAKPVGEPAPIPLAGEKPEPYKLAPSGLPVAKPVPPGVGEQPTRPVAAPTTASPAPLALEPGSLVHAGEGQRLDPRDQAEAREAARLRGRPIPQARPVDPGAAAETTVARREAQQVLGVLPRELRAVLGAIGPRAGTLGTVAGAGGAGLSGAMAAAGGPVGLALVAADAAAKGFRKVGDAAEAAGTGMAQLAGNDHLGAFKTGLGVAVGALEEIPVGGRVAAEALKTVGRAAGAFDAATRAFVNRARELAPYSGAITGALAVSEIRSLQLDIREAARLGPAMARMIDQQSRNERALREAFLPLKETLAKVLTAGLERAGDLIERNQGAIDAGVGAFDAYAKYQIAPMLDLMGRFVDGNAKAVEQLGELLGVQKKQAAKDDIDALHAITQKIIGLGSDLPAVPTAPDSAGFAAQQKLGPPLLGLN